MRSTTPTASLPTLLGVWSGGPYLHDGSAETLDAVFTVAGGEVIPAEDGTPSGGASIVDQYVDLNNDDTVRGRAYASLDDWWASTQDLSMRFADATRGLDASTKAEIQAALAEAAAPFTDADGAVAIPARTWTAAATA